MLNLNNIEKGYPTSRTLNIRVKNLLQTMKYTDKYYLYFLLFLSALQHRIAFNPTIQP